MRKVRRFARRLFVVVGVVAVFGPAGCGVSSRTRAESWQFRRAVEELSRSRTVREAPANPPAQVRPANSSPKPTKAVEDSDERHPSRWKRKLKAAYA